MMNDKGEHPSAPEIEQAGEDLFNYAIDRADVKWLLARLPDGEETNTGMVEYELQILKIISVGWSLSFHLESSTCKAPLLECFWKTVYDFSQTLSNTTGMMIGHDIDYFQILRDRLDLYVEALGRNRKASDPAHVIGPEFAEVCGDRSNLFLAHTGSKLFLSAVTRVKTYLAAIRFV
jgi:hypothetical protein